VDLTGHKATIPARVLSVDLSSFPGFADVAFDLADGTVAVVRDKLPVIGVEAEDETTLLHSVIAHESGDSVIVRLAYSMETTDDRNEVTVLRKNIRLID
jgi:hypothetical protein